MEHDERNQLTDPSLTKERTTPFAPSSNPSKAAEPHKYYLNRSCKIKNVGQQPAMLTNASTSREDQNLARTLEDLLNQRDQLGSLQNWYQYTAVLKVLDDKLEETRLKLFYGPEFDINRFKKWRAGGDGSNLKKNTVDINIPKDRGGHQNIVGRLVGPSGSTIKQLERDLCCKISIRGSALKRGGRAQFKPVDGACLDESGPDDGRELYMVATFKPSDATLTHLEFVEQALRHFVSNAVSTNADFDVLKKWQLIDLSKFRGQYRPSGRRSQRRNNAENCPPESPGSKHDSFEKSVTYPTIQVPVHLVAVSQLPSVSPLLSMPYQACYSPVEMVGATYETGKLATAVGHRTSSPATFVSAGGVSVGQSTSPNNTYTPTPQHSPSSVEVSPVQPTTTMCTAACTCTPTQPVYTGYTAQFNSQQTDQFGQPLVYPLQTLYVSQPAVPPAAPLADGGYLFVPTNMMETQAPPQPTYVYYPASFVTPSTTQQPGFH